MPISYKNKIYTTLGTPTALSGDVVSTTTNVGVPAKDYTVKGKTIVWNQLFYKNSTPSKNSDAITYSVDGNINILSTTSAITTSYFNFLCNTIANHKYMICAKSLEWNSPNHSNLFIGDSDNPDTASYATLTPSDLTKFFTATNETCYIKAYISYSAGNYEFKMNGLQLFDLTQMFGAGNEPTTVAEFRAMFPDDYYQYNAGELKTIVPTSVEASTANLLNLGGRKEISPEVVGDRASTVAYPEIDTYVYYKGVSPNGYLKSGAVVEATVLSSSIIAKTAENLGASGYGVGIPLTVVPSTTYYIKYTASASGVVSIGYLNSSKNFIDYSWTISDNQFTTPVNCRYVLLVFRPDTYGASATFENICVSTVQTNEHKPYNKHRVNIPSSKYFPDGMRSAGSAYDEINFLSQKAIKRIGAVDMGTLNWSSNPGTYPTNSFYSVGFTDAKGNTTNIVSNGKFYNIYANSGGNIIAITESDEQYDSSEAFKAAMSGVMLYYELATPVETAITPPLQALSTYKGFTSFSAPNLLTQNGPLSVTYYAEGGNNPESGWLTSYKRKLYMGRNIEWNQLLDKSKYPATTTTSGVTFTNNGDGTVTANGTAAANADFRVSATTYKILANHKCLITGGVNENAMVRFSGSPTGVWEDKGSGVITNQTVDTTAYNFSIRVNSGTTVSNVIFKPQLFDLTQMFGAGKEPSTPEEFWSYFDHKLYPYNTGETQPLFKISRKSQWGSVVSYPNKGDLITLDNKEYRVLKTNGSVAEVLAMYDSNDFFAFDNDNAIYANSGIDTYCNSTFYGALSTSMKNAIVEKTFTQDKWSLTSGASGGTGNIIYTGIDNDSDQYQIGLISTAYGTNISRKCYALSVQDVFDYLNVTTSMTAANTALNSTNIYKMFWNQTISNSDYIWLRSACYYDDVDCGFRADSDYGSLNYGDPVDSQTVRPAFQIDLSKVSWTPASSSSVTPAAKTITVQETSFAPAVSKLCSIRKVRGSFAGTPTLYTTANNANKIEVGNNGYEWVTKVNDDNQIVSGNDFLDAFGVSQTVDGTSLAGKTLGFMTKFSSRLSTTEGTDGGTFTSWGMSGEVEEIKSCEKEDLYCVVYNSETDTIKVYTLDEYDEQYGTFSVSAEIGYNTMIAFMLDATEAEV